MIKESPIPTLLIIFNRPNTVRRAIKALAEVKPEHLYIAADGPRSHVPSDKKSCIEARAIAQNVPWPCQIHTHFSDINLGVDRAVEDAINWFFVNEEEGVILEDDRIPHPDFFSYARELLVRYKDDPRVMMISGNNFQNGVTWGNASYYFSQYPNTWGWATWKRAWRLYDTNLTELPSFIKNKEVAEIRPRKIEQKYWLRYFDSLYKGARTAWDAKWLFAMWNNKGVSITPNINLVRNIGFDEKSTHTFASDNAASIQTEALGGAITHPSAFVTCGGADRHLFETLYKVTFRKRLLHLYNKVRRTLYI